MEINIKLTADLTMRDGVAVLNLTDGVPGAPWYASGAGSDFFDALERAVDGENGVTLRIYRDSGHRAILSVADETIDTGWAHE